MATYAEFLATQGATPEEIKLLDVPVARKAWEFSEASKAAAERDRQNLQDWYDNQALPAYKTMESQMMAARADAARNAALVQAAQDQGLLEVAKKAGVTDPALAPKTPEAAAAAGLDPSKYFTREEIVAIAEKEGEAIATAQDIAYEHRQLFPDRPMNFRELRKEASTKRIPVEQLWMDKFGVVAARAKRDEEAKAAYEKKLRDEGAAAVREELASKYGNFDTRPMVASVSPLAPRPASGREKQPWEMGDRTADRVKRATETLVKSTISN